MEFTAKERETLHALADALVPRTDGPLVASASELGVPALAEQAIATLPPDPQEEFRVFLRAVENPVLNLLLTGRPVRFSRLPSTGREEYLKSWARSGLAVKRRGFHAIKRLVCFLYYSAIRDFGNPAWAAIGYTPREESPIPPPDSRLVPLAVEREMMIETDVAVVGSGAGGSVVAAHAAKAGHRVLIIEAGPLLTPETFPRREFGGTDGMLERHGLLTTRDDAFGVLQARVAGGGTTINWMTCLRPPRWLLESWEKDVGIPGVAGPGFTANVDEVWARLGVTADESVLTPASLVLKRGCEALGLRIGADFHVTPKNARGCGNRCDLCNFGCVYGAKQSALVTYLPDAQARGAKLLFDTEVRTIESRDGRAELAAVHRQDGREIPVRVKAKAVVVAAGAVQTPALLLRSGLPHRGIGRGLRLHPTTAVGGIYEEPIRMWAGVPQTIHVDRWLTGDGDHHGFWLETVPAHPGLTALGFPWRGARAHKETMLQYAHTMGNIILVREKSAGRVSIDREGNPVLEYAMGSEDRRTMVDGIVQSAKVHAAARARAITSLHHSGGEIPYRDGPIRPGELAAFEDDVRLRGVEPNALALFSAHAMGSVPMGKEETYPTDTRGLLRGTSNVFIGDASVMPTAIGVNPMITIMGMARRTADFVVRGIR